MTLFVEPYVEDMDFKQNPISLYDIAPKVLSTHLFNVESMFAIMLIPCCFIESISEFQRGNNTDAVLHEHQYSSVSGMH